MSLKIAFDWHLRYSASAVHHKRPFFVNPPDSPFVLLNACQSSLSKFFAKLWLLIDMRKFTLLFFCEFPFFFTSREVGSRKRVICLHPLSNRKQTIYKLITNKKSVL